MRSQDKPYLPDHLIPIESSILNRYPLGDEEIPDVNVHGGLWYLEDLNCFTDDDGQVIYEMHTLFEPWVLRSILEHCRDNFLSFLPTLDRFGRLIDIFYLIKSDDTDPESYEILMGHMSSFPDDRNIIHTHHYA